MGYGKVVRYVLPDGAVARRQDRARRAKHARAAVGQWRIATGCEHRRPDLQYSDADRNDFARHHPVPGGCHRDRHAVWCRHGHATADVAEGRRHRAHRDRRHRRPRESGGGALTMTLHWIDKMAVEVDGEGDPVVMVHGLGGTTNTWTPLLPALTNAKRIRIELPGSGRSHRAHALQDNTPNKGQLSIDVLVDAVLRVCGQLGVSRAHFAGHSLGTIVCQHLAVREPERVRSLALFGALPAPPEPARQGLKTRAAKARDEGMFGIADAIVQAALSSSTREQLPVVVAFVRESLLAQDPEGYA